MAVSGMMRIGGEVLDAAEAVGVRNLEEIFTDREKCIKTSQEMYRSVNGRKERDRT